MKFLILLFLFSCGSEANDFVVRPVPKRPGLPKISIDPDLAPYVSLFLTEAEKFNVDTSLVSKLRVVEYGITASKKDPGAVGLCWTWKEGDEVIYTRIIIDERYREKTWSKKGLLMHELGHCILQKEHSPRSPSTIMSPSLSTDLYYERCWTGLLRNLFLDEKLDCNVQ